MTYIERHNVALTSDASGDATGYTPVVNGKVSNVIYDKTDYEDTVDITVSLEATGQVIWSESNVTASIAKAPRQIIHDADGFALATDPGGGAKVNHFTAAEDRVMIVIAQAGDTKSGTFTIVME